MNKHWTKIFKFKELFLNGLIQKIYRFEKI